VGGVDEPIERVYIGTLVTVHYINEHYHLYGAINTASRGRADSPFQHVLKAGVADTAKALRRSQDVAAVRVDDTAEHLAFAISAVVNEFVRFHQHGTLGRTIADVAAQAARFTAYGVAADTALAEAAVAAHPRLVRKASAARRRRPDPLSVLQPAPGKNHLTVVPAEGS
jgi:phospholipase/lecithinase/hemolysin